MGGKRKPAATAAADAATAALRRPPPLVDAPPVASLAELEAEFGVSRTCLAVRHQAWDEFVLAPLVFCHLAAATRAGIGGVAAVTSSSAAAATRHGDPAGDCSAVAAAVAGGDHTPDDASASGGPLLHGELPPVLATLLHLSALAAERRRRLRDAQSELEDDGKWTACHTAAFFADMPALRRFDLRRAEYESASVVAAACFGGHVDAVQYCVEQVGQALLTIVDEEKLARGVSGGVDPFFALTPGFTYPVLRSGSLALLEACINLEPVAWARKGWFRQQERAAVGHQPPPATGDDSFAEDDIAVRAKSVAWLWECDADGTQREFRTRFPGISGCCSGGSVAFAAKYLSFLSLPRPPSRWGAAAAALGDDDVRDRDKAWEIDGVRAGDASACLRHTIYTSSSPQSLLETAIASGSPSLVLAVHRAILDANVVRRQLERQERSLCRAQVDEDFAKGNHTLITARDKKVAAKLKRLAPPSRRPRSWKEVWALAEKAGWRGHAGRDRGVERRAHAAGAGGGAGTARHRRGHNELVPALAASSDSDSDDDDGESDSSAPGAPAHASGAVAVNEPVPSAAAAAPCGDGAEGSSDDADSCVEYWRDPLTGRAIRQFPDKDDMLLTPGGYLAGCGVWSNTWGQALEDLSDDLDDRYVQDALAPTYGAESATSLYAHAIASGNPAMVHLLLAMGVPTAPSGNPAESRLNAAVAVATGSPSMVECVATRQRLYPGLDVVARGPLEAKWELPACSFLQAELAAARDVARKMHASAPTLDMPGPLPLAHALGDPRVVATTERLVRAHVQRRVRVGGDHACPYRFGAEWLASLGPGAPATDRRETPPPPVPANSVGAAASDAHGGRRTKEERREDARRRAVKSRDGRGPRGRR